MIGMILKLLACHMIGDYVLQSDYIASTKGQNWWHMFVHCFLYAVPFYICFGGSGDLLTVFIMHMIIDPLKARWGKISYLEDQLCHLATLTVYLH